MNCREACAQRVAVARTFAIEPNIPSDRTRSARTDPAAPVASAARRVSNAPEFRDIYSHTVTDLKDELRKFI